MISMLSDLMMDRIVELKGMSDMTQKGFVYVYTNFSENRAEGSMLVQYIGVTSTLDVQEVKWEFWRSSKY